MDVRSLDPEQCLVYEAEEEISEIGVSVVSPETHVEIAEIGELEVLVIDVVPCPSPVQVQRKPWADVFSDDEDDVESGPWLRGYGAAAVSLGGEGFVEVADPHFENVSDSKEDLEAVISCKSSIAVGREAEVSLPTSAVELRRDVGRSDEGEVSGKDSMNLGGGERLGDPCEGNPKPNNLQDNEFHSRDVSDSKEDLEAVISCKEDLEETFGDKAVISCKEDLDETFDEQDVVDPFVPQVSDRHFRVPHLEEVSAVRAPRYAQRFRRSTAESRTTRSWYTEQALKNWREIYAQSRNDA